MDGKFLKLLCGQIDFYQIHGIENCFQVCHFVIHRKVSWRKPSRDDQLVFKFVQKFRD